MVNGSLCPSSCVISVVSGCLRINNETHKLEFKKTLDSSLGNKKHQNATIRIVLNVVCLRDLLDVTLHAFGDTLEKQDNLTNIKHSY